MLCLFYSCPPRFRAWGQGASREAGSWQADTGRELTGDQTFTSAANGWTAYGYGAFGESDKTFNTMAMTGGTMSQTSAYNFRASRVWGAEHTGTEFSPVHVSIPAVLYLGRSSEV